MLHFVTSDMKHNKSRKQTLESVQYGLEISFTGPLSATPLFLFTYESLAIISYLKHVKSKDITMKLLKIIKPSVRNATYSELTYKFRFTIGNCRNVRGLGKSMVVFRLFEKLRYLNERSTKFESLYQE